MGALPPRPVQGRRPEGRAARHRRHEAHRRRRLRADLRRRRPAGRLLGVRRPRLHPQAPRGGGGLLARRDDHDADDLRRDAAGLLRPGRAGEGPGDQPRRGQPLLPDLPAVLRPDLHRAPRPRHGPGVREGLQRLDGRGVVRRLERRPDPPHHRAAVGRRAGRRRGAPQRRARRARRVLLGDPPHLGLPSIHSGSWDPFLAACEDTETTINMHIGSSSRMPATSPDAPVAVAASLSFNNSMASLADWLFSGKLVQFPKLTLAYSEGQIGWLPYLLERVDDVWKEHRAWGGVKDLIPEPPSMYYFRNVYGCFFRDRHGLVAIDEVGEDNITFETDYPHTDSTWPDTKQVAEKMVEGLTDEQVYKAMRGNAIRMLHLDLDRDVVTTPGVRRTAALELLGE
ncbi:MAG: amidohydrolase family protein [Acidimicrobiales bacterium]